MVTTFKDEIEDEGFKSMEASAEFTWKPVEFPESSKPIQDDRDPNPFSWHNFLLEYYRESVRDRLDYIRVVNVESGFYQELREKHHDNWETVELCREILWENVRLIDRLQEGIGNDRTEIKKLSRV